MVNPKRQIKALGTLKVGSVFAVPLGDGTYGFGQICNGMDHAYFDLRSETILPLENVIAHRVLFRIPVAVDAIKSGKWSIIGQSPLTGNLAEPGKYRHQPVGSNQLYLYQAGQSLPADLEKVKDLELFAVWFDMHVVERLLDHFAAKPHRTVEFFKIIKKYDTQTGQEIR